MSGIVGHLVWAFVAGSAIALATATCVLALVRGARPRARVRAWLWFFTALLCVIAPVIIGGAMVLRPARPAPPPAARTTAHRAERTAPFGRVAAASRVALEPPHFAPPVEHTIAYVWLAGVLIGLAGLGRSLWRVRALKVRSSPLDATLACELPWLTEVGGREIYLRLSYEIETPIAVGFRRPVILVPTEMATQAGLRAIEPLIMHEHAHLAHYDDWTNLAQRIVERVAWCNPLVWIAGRAFALEREVAADDAVVARTDDVRSYAATLWQMAREMRMPEHVVVAPGAIMTRKQISVRIERLLEGTRPRPALAGLAGVVAVGVAGVAAVAATAPPLATAPVASAPVASAPVVSAPATHAPPAPPPPKAWPTTVVAALAVPTPSIDADALARSLKRHVADMLRQADDSLQQHRTSRARGAAALAQNDCNGCDLSRADLRGKDLRGHSFNGTDLNHADLRDADLRGADMMGTDLHFADLRGADLRNAHIVGADLRHADLRNADARGTDFTGADLSNATLDGTRLDGATLMGATLP